MNITRRMFSLGTALLAAVPTFAATVVTRLSSVPIAFGDEDGVIDGGKGKVFKWDDRKIKKVYAIGRWEGEHIVWESTGDYPATDIRRDIELHIHRGSGKLYQVAA